MAHSTQYLKLETPEKINFTYKIGGIGLRIAAYLIDMFIQDAIVVIGLIIILITMANGNDWDSLENAFDQFQSISQYFVIATAIFVYFLLKWGYFLFFEMIFSGQTIGKKICKLRVIRIDGTRLDFASLFIRNFLRVADALPSADLLGGLMLIITKQNRRLGDLAAGTVVVIDKKDKIKEPHFETKLKTSPQRSQVNNPREIRPKSLIFIPVNQRLDEKNLYILRDILNNRDKLPTDSAISVGKSIVEKLESQYDLSPLRSLNDYEIIEEVYKAHHYTEKDSEISSEETNKPNQKPDSFIQTKSELFVAKRRERWHQTINLMLKIRKGRSRHPLTFRETKQFPVLYRQLCHDLAEARTFKLSPDILSYLNTITGQAHHLLYFYKPINGPAIKKFFSETLFNGIIKNWRYVAAAMILFWGTGAISFIHVKNNGLNALKMVPSSVLEQMDMMYEEPLGEQPIAERIFMTAFYINNNVSIGFVSFASGVILGLGAIGVILFNGLYLGVVFGYLGTKPASFENLITFITAHSFLELTGIVLCGAAGIRLGVALLQSWRDHSNLGIENHKEDILTLLFIGALMIFMAAPIEGFISPQPWIPYQIKLGVAVLSALAFIGIFIAYPLYRQYKIKQRKKEEAERLKGGIIYG